MNRADLNRALSKAESWTETYNLWKIGLPAPFTFVVEAGLLAAAFVAGVWLL